MIRGLICALGSKIGFTDKAIDVASLNIAYPITA